MGDLDESVVLIRFLAGMAAVMTSDAMGQTVVGMGCDMAALVKVPARRCRYGGRA